MQPVIRGPAFVLGDNVDTDQIIPAEYLTYNPAVPAEYRMFGKFALCGVPKAGMGLPRGGVPFHKPDDEFTSAYRVIVAGKNFGCGSSREHAPVALAAAGISCVVAEFYARIFYRNAVNGAYLVPAETDARLVERVCTGDDVSVDVEAGVFTNHTTGEVTALKPLGAVAPIIAAGGVFEYARRQGMIGRAGGAREPGVSAPG